MNCIVFIFWYKLIGDGTINGRTNASFICFDGTIIELEQLCDGNSDCVSGNDETNPICASKTSHCV